METDKNWRFCVVGNIVKSHLDEEGIERYGTKAFTGGTKVYVGGKYMTADLDEMGVIGLNRFGKYVTENVPVRLIENFRWQAIFKPTVIEIMDYLERLDGWPWWGRTAADKKEVMALAEALNTKLSIEQKSGKQEEPT